MQQDRQKLLRYLQAGECVTVVGIPGIGKSLFTWSLRSAQHNFPLDHRLRFIIVNLNDLTENSAHIFYWLLLQRLLETLPDLTGNQNVLSQANKIYESSRESIHDLGLFDRLKQLVALYVDELDLQPVLVLDEFEGFARSADPGIYKNLIALRDSFKQGLHFVFITQNAPQAIKKAATDYFYQDLTGRRLLYLSPLTKNESREFLSLLTRAKGVTVPPDLFQAIFKLSGGHAGLFKDLARMLLKTPSSEVKSGDLLEQALKDEGVLTRLNRIKRRGVTLELLQSRKLSIPLLTEFLSQEKKSPGVFTAGVTEVDHGATSTTRLVYDEATNQILINGQPHPDLTAMEFSFVKYLLENMRRVCSKDEVAEHVWRGKLNDGVSDEAIDKLAQRVRAKIEPDKSHPQYLLTIRGRGYQLVN